MKKFISVMTDVVLLAVIVMLVALIGEIVTDYIAYQQALQVRADLERLLGQPVKFTVTNGGN